MAPMHAQGNGRGGIGERLAAVVILASLSMTGFLPGVANGQAPAGKVAPPQEDAGAIRPLPVRPAGEGQLVPAEQLPVRIPGGIRQMPGSSGSFDLRAIRTAAVPEEVRRLVDDLGDEDWAVRESSSRSLESHPAPDTALLRILDEGELSEEQRQRLMGVVSRRILLRERGAIGIRMNQRTGFGVDELAGVQVTEVLPGLPAERVLLPGDLIVRIDDREIRVSTDLIQHVQRLPPGRVIRVRVLRPVAREAGDPVGEGWVEDGLGRWFEPIETEFPLGSFAQLGENRGTVNPETRRREAMVLELRAIWDRAPRSLDGRVTVDGVVPPPNVRLPAPGQIRRP